MTRSAIALTTTLLLAGLGGCSSDNHCAAASQHLARCVPGLAADHDPVCGPVEETRALQLLSQDCSQLLTSLADGKADTPRLRGLLVEKVGNLTFFKIPLAETFGGDRKRLFEETVAKFISGMKTVNTGLIERGIDLGLILDDEGQSAFSAQYLDVVDRIVSTDVEDEMQVRLGEVYARPTTLSSWRRYVTPQAFLAYFGTKFTVNWGVGGGISATVLLVAQPWLSLGIDHTMARPQVVVKEYVVDTAVLGVPNVDVGGGIGGGAPLRIGGGAVFGPLDRPEDLGGWAIGASGSLALPFVGGGNGKFITVMKKPPLFMLLGGYTTGTTAGGEIHGGIQAVMNFEQFLGWIQNKVPWFSDTPIPS